VVPRPDDGPHGAFMRSSILGTAER
jgi:hypothetical protein